MATVELPPDAEQVLRDALNRWLGNEFAMSLMALSPVLGEVTRDGTASDKVFLLIVDGAERI